MATTWTISRMEYLTSDKGKSKVVHIVHWMATAEDGDRVAIRPGTSTLAYKEGGAFVDYDSLTEAKVLEWVKAALGEDRVESIEADLAKELAAQPVTADAMPWAKAAE